MTTSTSFSSFPVEQSASYVDEETSIQKELSLSPMLFCLPVELGNDLQNYDNVELEIDKKN